MKSQGVCGALKQKKVPLIIEALDLDKKGLGKDVEKISGSINIEELQKISLLGQPIQMFYEKCLPIK